MSRQRYMVAFAATALVGVLTQVGSAALAKKAGGSGLSGTLSSNAAIRRQQLIADPAPAGLPPTTLPTDAPKRGSTSVLYDPTSVTVEQMLLGPGYVSGTAYVEIEGGKGGSTMVSLANFLQFGGTETGYLQVFFDTEFPVIKAGITPAGIGTPGQIPIATGFTQNDQDGPEGFDTYQLIFGVLPTVPLSHVLEYTIFADLGNRPSFNNRDGLVGEDQDGEYAIDAPNITSATVRGSLDVVPLPAAVWMGGAMLAGMWAKRRLTLKAAA